MGSSLGANLLAKKLRNVRTGVKQGDFRVRFEKSRTVWRERPKRTRAGFVPYCLARAILATWSLAPNRKVTYCLARTFFADLAPYRLARGSLFTGPLKKSPGSFGAKCSFGHFVLYPLAPSAFLGISCCTLWRQVVCWAPLAKLLVEQKYVLFWLAEKSPTSFCFRRNTTQLALGKYALFWLQAKSPMRFCFRPNTTQLAFGR